MIFLFEVDVPETSGRIGWGDVFLLQGLVDLFACCERDRVIKDRAIKTEGMIFTVLSAGIDLIWELCNQFVR